MRLNFTVLASTAIKRRKPWPKLSFLGELHESLMLLDRQRVSVLYIPSGRTKRKVTKLHAYLPSTVTMATSDNGLFLAGLLQSGDVFIWHKDTDQLKLTSASEELCRTLQTPNGGSAHLSVSNDGTKMLLVLDRRVFFVWQLAYDDALFASPHIATRGSWSQVDVNFTSPPTLDCNEAAMHTIFHVNQLAPMGTCCTCSLAFNIADQLCMTTLTLAWHECTDDYDSSTPAYQSTWHTTVYPLAELSPSSSSNSTMRSHPAVYLMRHSHDGHLVALAISGSHCVVFIHPGTNTVVCCDVGASWLVDMAWTHDDLLLACITRQGSVAVLSRLGEPLVLTAEGCSLQMGPHRWLPLHPLITVSECAEGTASDQLATTSKNMSNVIEQSNDTLGQCFSITTHPRLPLIVCSDGFMVTVLQLAIPLTCVSLLRHLVYEAHTNMDVKCSYEPSPHAQTVPYQFEEVPTDAPDLSHDTNWLAMGTSQLSSGRLVFASPPAEPDMGRGLGRAKACLLTAWRLAVSHSGLWTSDHEIAAHRLVEDTIVLFKEEASDKKWKHLVSAVSIFNDVSAVLPLDGRCRHLLLCALKLTHGAVTACLEDITLKTAKSQLRVLHLCYALLRSLQQRIIHCYADRTEGKIKDTNKHHSSACMCLVTNDQKNKNDDDMTRMDGAKVSQRLGITWRLLSKHAVTLYQRLNAAKIKNKTEARAVKKALHLVVVLQNRLCELGSCSRTKHKLNIGAALSIAGNSSQALHSWCEQVESLTDAQLAGFHGDRILHAILYTLLLQGELRLAVDFVEMLLQGDDIKSSVQAVCTKRSSQNGGVVAKPTDPVLFSPSVPVQPVRHVVMSLACVMAAYFCNLPMFVYAAHAPRRLPGFCRTTNRDVRQIPLSRDNMKTAASTLVDCWSPSQAVRYMLLAGQPTQAAMLTHTLGDNNATFLLAATSYCHHRALPQLYQQYQKLQLPQSLQPELIVQQRLKDILNLQSTADISLDDDTTELTRCVNSLLLASSLCHLSVSSWLVTQLIREIKSLCCQFSALVTCEFYLPAPPLYCPQPAPNEQEFLSAAEQTEVQLRCAISVRIQQLVLVMSSCHALLPAARSYSTALMEAVAKAKKLTPSVSSCELSMKTLEESFICQPSAFTGLESNPEVHCVLAGFRDLCCVVWMLYVRDKLSMGLRLKMVLTENKINGSPVNPPLHSHCEDTLHWAIRLLPFGDSFQNDPDSDESIIPAIIISLLTELHPSEGLMSLLTRHLPEMDALPVTAQNQLTVLLKSWENAGMGSVKRSVTTEYQRLAAKTAKLHARKCKAFSGYKETVDLHVTQSESAECCIGSWPFESDHTYVNFLELFFSVCFGHALQAESEASSPANCPLMACFSDTICQTELGSMPSVGIQGGTSDVRRTSRPRVARSPGTKVGLTLLTGGSNSCLEEPLIPHCLKDASDQFVCFDLNHKFGDKTLNFNTSPWNNESHVSNSTANNVHLKDMLKSGKNWSDKGCLRNLLTWLSRWGSRMSQWKNSHSNSSSSSHKGALHVSLDTECVLYSLWLLEHIHPPASQVPDVVTVNVLHTVHRHQVTSLPVMSPPTLSSTSSPTVTPRCGMKALQQQNCNNNHGSVNDISDDDYQQPNETRHSKPRKNSKQGDYERTLQTLENSVNRQRDHVNDGDSLLRLCDNSSGLTEVTVALTDCVSDSTGEPSIDHLNDWKQRTDEDASLQNYSRNVQEEDAYKSTMDMRDSAVRQPASKRGKKDKKDKRARSSKMAMEQTLRWPSEPTEPSDVINMTPETTEVSERTEGSKRNSTNRQLMEQLREIVKQEMHKALAEQQREGEAIANDRNKQLQSVPRVQDEDNMSTSQKANTGNFSAHDNAWTLRRPLRLSELVHSGDIYELQGALQELQILRQQQQSLQQQTFQQQSLQPQLTQHQFLQQQGQQHQQQQQQQQESVHQRNHMVWRGSDKENVPCSSQTIHSTSPTDSSMVFGRVLHLANQMKTELTKTKNTPLLHLKPSSDVSKRQHTVKPIVRMPLLHIDKKPAKTELMKVPTTAAASQLPRVQQFSRLNTSAHVDSSHHMGLPQSVQTSPLLKTPVQRTIPVVPPPPSVTGHMKPMPLLRLNTEKRPPIPTYLKEEQKKADGSRHDRQLTDDRQVTYDRQVTDDRHVTDNRANNVDQPLHQDAELTIREMRQETNEKSDDISEQTHEDTADNTHDLQRKPVLVSEGVQAVSETADIDEHNKLYAGFALSRGLFDDYLKKAEEEGALYETNASIQYNATQTLASQPVKTRDASMETDKLFEMTTSPRNNAVSALHSYLQASGRHQAAALAPDIFLGLQFPDTNQQSLFSETQTLKPDSGRDFVNVIDIDSSLLDDAILQEFTQPSQPSPAKVVDTSPAKVIDTAGFNKTSASNNLDKSVAMTRLADNSTIEQPPSPLPRPDIVTESLFASHPQNSVNLSTVDVIGVKDKVTADMRRRLANMNNQFSSIAKMADNIEKDFESTKSLLKAIDKVSRRGEQETNRETGREAGNDDRSEVMKYEPLKPSAVKRMTQPVDKRQAETELKTTSSRYSTRTNVKLSMTESVYKDHNGDDGCQVDDSFMIEKSMIRQTPEKQKTDRKLTPSPRRHNADRAAEQNRCVSQRVRLATDLMNSLLADKIGNIRSHRQNTAAPSELGRPSTAPHRTTGLHSEEQSAFPTPLPRQRVPSAWQEPVEPGAGHNDLLTDRSTDLVNTSRSVPVGGHRTEPEQSIYKPRAFTDFVRLQRPDITRCSRPPAKRAPMPQSVSKPHRPPQALTRKLYGSARIPGTQKLRTAPRQVKTYTQRLREMKGTRPQRGPITHGVKYTSGAVDTTLTTRPAYRPCKPRKSVPYTQQLQQLQPPKVARQPTSQVGHQATVRIQRPLHKPKTYAQQLQELQRPATVRLPCDMVTSSLGYSTQRLPTGIRTAPVTAITQQNIAPNDPYSDDISEEPSSWNLSEDVKAILYGQNASITSYSATDVDLSDLADFADTSQIGDENTHYSDAVALAEIEEAASLSNASIMSFIDWDQIDCLISDVK